MKIKQSFKIALNIILHSKVRSWLTIIGIIIGIAAIVSIVSLGQGAQQTLEQNLNSLSANIITVSPGFSRAAGAGAGFRSGFGEGSGRPAESAGSTAAKNLTVKDVTLLRGIPNIEEVMGIISGSTKVSYISQSSTVSIEGVDPSIWKDFTTTELISGRYLSQGDTDVAVIGGRIASTTFTDMQINRQITINGKTFKIIGILQQTGSSDDSRIFIPIKDAVNVLENKDEKNFDSIIIKIKDISLSDDTVNETTKMLMLSHGILQSKNQDFSVVSLKSIQQRVSTTLGSMSIFLTAIAAISLIVGAIGVMNSQFTSVLEKTREIGILKALGAKNTDILTIFLLSSGIIGLIGGIFGVVLGIIGSSFIGQLAGNIAGGGRLSMTYVSPLLVIEVFLLSIILGLLAGAIPAYRASKLKPVDALRYE